MPTPLQGFVTPSLVDAANIATGFSTFANANEKYLVMRFTTAAARTAAITSPEEGMVVALTTDNLLTYYTGAAWTTLAVPHGALTTFTPTLTQGATPTFTTNRATYSRTGRRVQGDAILTLTATTGTAANNVLVGLPVSAATTSGYTIIGQAIIVDTSAGFVYYADLTYNAGSVCSMLRRVDGAGLSHLGSSSFTAALAVGDIVSYRFDYEAAAD